MRHRGENTQPAQRRLNLRNSCAKLEQLLAANFRDGAQLVTLTYWEGARIPSRRLAELQVHDWLRAVRAKSGTSLRYIRATGWDEAGDGFPIHRVVLGPSGAAVAPLAALWSYGAIMIKPIQRDGLEALAALLMHPALEAGRVVVPCGRTWSPSVGLNRPEKKGEMTI